MTVVRHFYRGYAAGGVHSLWLPEQHQIWQRRGLHCKLAAPVVLAAAAGPALNITAAQPPLPPITAQSIDNRDILTPQQPLSQLGEDAGHSSKAYCQADNLSGLLRQFGTYQEGFDNGLQLDGLMAYYRRLGCSAEQLQDAVYSMMPPIASSSSARRAGVPGSIIGMRAQPDLELAPASGTQAGATAAPADFTFEAGAGRVVSGASNVQFSESPWQPPGGLGEQVQLAAWELLAAALAAAALAAYESRPRGWSRGDLLEARTRVADWSHHPPFCTAGTTEQYRWSWRVCPCTDRHGDCPGGLPGKAEECCGHGGEVPGGPTNGFVRLPYR
ncbi:hypothetical protein Vafri_13057 [Volvox africanus]|uniref:Uncharacterized protein n=1 Tax=Volvox africanus TaxID=51714 RepID=A0A8J4BFM0_9CHLO|nr:hypothetical protein Vafri_13057 [Volvox africanus]